MKLPDWPPSLSDAQKSELTYLAATYALANGLAYLPVHPPEGPPIAPLSAIHAPFTLFPTPFPRALFEQSQRLQNVYNILYSRIALDEDFLDSVMGHEKGVGKVDEFVGNLWSGWKRIRESENGVIQPFHLGLFRSDYLLHSTKDKLTIKQVEFNTISSSFGPLSEGIAAMHKYLALTTGYFGVSPILNPEHMPTNHTRRGLVGGLAVAHNAYIAQFSSKASILFVVQPGERNVFDQRWLEYELLESHGVATIHLTFSEIAKCCRVAHDTGVLTAKLPTRPQPVEVSVVYYRAGYTPADYLTTSDYETRFLLESSRAIKCPTIPLQLAGGKKIQQVLSNAGVLERFLKNPEKWGTTHLFSDQDLQDIRDSWMNMWGLDDKVPEEGVPRARANAKGLVLKPQREGGGNNVYKSSIPAFLDQLPEKEWEAWIAMEMILPPNGIYNYMTKAGEANPLKKDVVSELGIFGWSLFGWEQGDKKICRITEAEAGWLVRTKGRESDEGGVAVGFSVLDSLVLI